MKKNNKGFTLAELLIVVAIIAVLVAISIPVFGTQLEKSKEATDISNIRAAYAEAMAEYIGQGNSGTITKSVKMRQGVAGWATEPAPYLNTRIDGVEGSTSVFPNVEKDDVVNVNVAASGSTTVVTVVKQ